MSALSLVHRRVDDTHARRELEDALSKSRSALARARVDYAFALDSHASLSTLRRDYHRLSSTYRRAVSSMLALEQDRAGSMTGALEEMRRRQQRHLLLAPAGVLIPVVVQPTSNAPYGPLIPGTDMDPDEPLGAQTGRQWGLDLPVALDATGTG